MPSIAEMLLKKRTKEIPQSDYVDYGFGPIMPAIGDGMPQGSVSATPDKPSMADTLAEYGSMPAKGATWLASELTGVPALVRGGERIGQSVYDATYGDGMDPYMLGAGVGEATLGAVPAAALTKTGGSMLAKLLSSPWKATGAGMGAMAPETAYAAKKAKKEAEVVAQAAQPQGYEAIQAAVKGIPELETMYQLWRDKDAQSKLDQPSIKDRAEGNRIRTRLGEEAEQLRKDLLSKIEARRLENAPFRERYPGAAEAIGGLAAGVATGLPFANSVKSRLARALIDNPRLNREAEALDALFKNKKTTDAELAAKQDQLARRVDAYDEKNTGVLSDIAHSMPLSALTAFEGAAIPEQVDALSYAPGHPVREAARAELTRPGYYQERAPAAVMSGLLTSGLGTKAGHLITPGAEPANMAMARELIQRGTPDSLARLEQLRSYRQAATGPGGTIAGQPHPAIPGPSSGPQSGPLAHVATDPTVQTPMGQAGMGTGPSSSSSPMSRRYTPEDSAQSRSLLAEALKTGAPPTSVTTADITANLAAKRAPAPAGLEARRQATMDYIKSLEDRGVKITPDILMGLPSNIGKSSLLAAPIAATVAAGSKDYEWDDTVGRYRGKDGQFKAGEASD